MEYNFNWSSVSSGAPYISIAALGISFNSTAIEKLGTPEKLQIGFDEKHLVLAFKPYCGNEDINFYEFASRIKNGWIRIGCKDFVNYLEELTGNDYTKSTKYTAKFNDEYGALLIQIDNKKVVEESV